MSFKDIRFRIERKLEQEADMSGLSVDEIKRLLAEDWGYNE